MTRWAADVRPDNVLPEYPRPQMNRSEWLNLNGLWEYAIRQADAPAPETYDGHILVPFPAESALSGVRKAVSKENRLWYRRIFQIPISWRGRRILLNFEAVEWETRVWVNGKEAGVHKGGYDPFSFDITKMMKRRGDQEIIVSVWDPIDEGTQPRGKQVRSPRGIWYTSVTGIWSTVWLEPVGDAHIQALQVVPDFDGQKVRITANSSQAAQGFPLEISVLDGSNMVASAKGKTGEEIILDLPNPKPWSPDSPFLYDIKPALLGKKDKKADEVAGYFGMRKHVKVEPRRFYYWCDKLGLMVWQDMPSGDGYIRPQDPDLQRSEESTRQFEQEFSALIKALSSHPSIVMWVCFNEGWGQFDTPRIVEWVRSLDPTRLVNGASGWTDRGVGDVIDIHSYLGPAAPPHQPNRAAVLGEFGGLGLPIRGHTWQDEKNWGYRSFTTPEELTEAYIELIEKLKPLISGGLSAGVYTQTTDVEIEVNGLMTYDRAVVKMDKESVSRANKGIY